MNLFKNVFAILFIGLLTFTSCTKEENVLKESTIATTESTGITDLESLLDYMEINPPILQDLDYSNREGFLPGVAPDAIKKMNIDLNGDGQLREVEVEIKRGMVVLGKDMVLGTEAEVMQNQRKAVSRAVNTNNANLKWKNGFIPIVLDQAIINDRAMNDKLSDALAELESKTVLTFGTRNNKHTDYIFFKKSTDGNYSWMGRQGGRQQVNIEAKAPVGTYIHEIMHAVGFIHEQNRCDREDHVTIFGNNIQADKHSQFKKECNGADDYGNYNFSSVMHYHPKAFSRNNDYTILPVTHKVWIFDDMIRFYDELGKMGQRDGLSAGDITAIDALYVAPKFEYGNLSSKSGDMAIGDFIQQAGTKNWIEAKKGILGQRHYFTESHRDEWSIYLRDEGRGIGIQIDMYRQKIIYQAKNGKRSDLYNILRTY